ncbi:thiamine-phosphate diphosphorylase [Clostridium acidisoli DSM 12555]|uniref:Thiamine-phosphate synthase n=1 Tax=Clostridium acidisoli DSM 12555 TaxID=1121291 RepID=A0A1W1XTP8_9CLOT|nr:thiamine phosphate synthase [Clostridium acidisoli]SMC27225.1 thiamine-phosphate diphosphorylase [Clostridium acidisoli DSM 12555]
MKIDYSLYLVTDRSFLGGKSIEEAVEEAIKGGVTLVQVREKDASSREFYEVALKVKKVTDKYKVPLIIDDRLDIAQAVDASGVHLGQSDLPLKLARNILGKDKIIGISVGNVAEAKEAEADGADYVGIGTIFFTGTKKDIKTPIGIEGLTEIVENIKIPSVAIGGINQENTKAVLKSGTNGVAVISAILGKKDIRGAAEEFRK